MHFLDDYFYEPQGEYDASTIELRGSATDGIIDGKTFFEHEEELAELTSKYVLYIWFGLSFVDLGLPHLLTLLSLHSLHPKSVPWLSTYSMDSHRRVLDLL